MLTYIPTDHYWAVAADAERVYSSARRAYVPLDDAGYQAWLGRGWTSAVAMPSEAALWALLTAQAPQCLPDDVQHVPQVVSRFQAKAALAQAGLLDAVEAAIAGADAVAKLAWADAVEFRRDSPTIAALAVSLEMTSQQVDALFVAAAQISA